MEQPVEIVRNGKSNAQAAHRKSKATGNKGDSKRGRHATTAPTFNNGPDLAWLVRSLPGRDNQRVRNPWTGPTIE